MLTAQITNIVSKLSYGDRAELVSVIVDSFDDADIPDDHEDSLSVALQRSAELKSGAEDGITVDELWESIQASRVRQ
jgi:hypothetical protein